MKLKVPSPKLGGTDPEEKEISDEDDDDRNHKHRRKETHSQSLETDSIDMAFTKSYRKRNNNGSPLDKDSASKFNRRHPGLTSVPHRGHPGPGGRGRGRGNSSWNQRDPRFNSVDMGSQMVHPGSIAPGLFAGRGLSNVSNVQSPSWGAFGMMPGIPNGGLDTLHPIGLQGVLRPPMMNSSLNMGIPRQRCRDFEERGFCLRGDMCPMEHGVNRIVIEDVQSLSQFNLPVTVPSSQLLAIPAGPRPLPSSVPPTTLMNSKGIHSKNSKPGMTDDALGLNGAYTGSTSAGVADLYDPDQPLWNDYSPEASAALSGLRSPHIYETEPLLNGDTSDHHHGRLHDSADNELSLRSVGSQGVWGRIGSSSRRIDTKEKIDLTQSDYPENETKEEQEAFPSSQGTSCQVKRISTEDDGSKVMGTPFKSQTDSMRNSRKPTQKALRTLFVNGIPLKSNKREALLSHFRKFGEVIDIYIRKSSEKAFVQFSSREEAEAALKAPDAVMGNRFIKLWWANRDSVPDDGINGGSSVAITSCSPTVPAVPAQLVVNRGKNNLQPIAQKSNAVSGAAVHSLNSPNPSSGDGPKVPLSMQKKLELERLKEELRKKQEMLEQKRNDFRRQLEDKLQKQSSGVKGDLPTEQAAKRQKVGIAADPEKASTPSFPEPGSSTTIPCTAGTVGTSKSTENVVSHGPTSNTTKSLLEYKSSKQQSRPSAPVGHPFVMNKYKLDRRPTAFRVIPPLPSSFADIDVLKQHFLQYGDLSAVELEDVKNDNDTGSAALNNCSVVITYGTRRSAEKAYISGKSWQGNNLQFTWLASSNSSNGPGSKETLSSTPKGSLEADVPTEGKLACSVSPEVIASGNKESNNSESGTSVEHMELPEVIASGNKETKNSKSGSFVEHMELPEVSEQSSSPSSSVKESPKGDTY